MRYLITGATGFIGKAFIETLSDDDSVLVITRDQQVARSRLGGVAAKLGFIENTDLIKNLDDVDCIINLAGEPIADKRWTRSQKHTIEQSRWAITSKLASLCQSSEDPPHTFLSGSAIGFYGRQGTTPVTEAEYQVHEEFSQKLCTTWESIALGAQSEKTRVCLLRTGIVLGEGQGALAKMTLPFKLGLGGKIGSGQQGMSWIHIDDMIQGMHFLINNLQLHGAFNFTAPQPVDNQTFVSTLGSVLQRPTVLPAPAFALNLLMGESADLLLTGQFVLPEALQQAGYSFKYPDLDSALRAIF